MVEEAFTVGFHVPPRTLALAGLCGAVLWSTKLLYAEVEVDPTPDILATVEGLCAFRFLMPWRLEVEERVMSQPRPRMVIGTWYRVHGPGWSGFAALEVRPVCALEQEDDPVDPDHEHVSVSRRIRRGRSHEEHVIKLVLRVRWCNLAKAQAFFSAKTQTPIHEPGSIKTTKVMTKVATVHVSKQKAPLVYANILERVCKAPDLDVDMDPFPRHLRATNDGTIQVRLPLGRPITFRMDVHSKAEKAMVVKVVKVQVMRTKQGLHVGIVDPRRCSLQDLQEVFKVLAAK